MKHQKDIDFCLGVQYVDESTEDLGRLVRGRYNLGNGNWLHKKHGLAEDRAW